MWTAAKSEPFTDCFNWNFSLNETFSRICCHLHCFQLKVLLGELAVKSFKYGEKLFWVASRPDFNLYTASTLNGDLKYWGPNFECNGDLRQQKWGPKKLIFEELTEMR